MPETTDLMGEVARGLIECETGRRSRAPLTAEEWPDLTADEGYRIQDAVRELREKRGERVIGVKMGLTSRAKQQTMKVDRPIVGWVTDVMRVSGDEPLPADRFIHPRAEPELFFRLGTDLSGSSVTREDAASAVALVCAGVDIIDSRYDGYSFTLPDVTADSASAAGFVFGPVLRSLSEVDLELESVIVEVDGAIVDSATGAAILGHPLDAVVSGVHLLAERGHGLRAGDWVLAGAMTDAVPVTGSQSLAFHWGSLGSIHIPRSV